MAYDKYPAVDSNYNFPPAVREAIAAAQELKDTFVPLSRGGLPTGTNLNTLIGPEHVGTWTLTYSSTYTNKPAGLTGTATLEVQRGSGSSLAVVQRVTDGSLLQWRESIDAAAGTWSVWSAVTTKAEFNTTIGDHVAWLEDLSNKDQEIDGRLDGLTLSDTTNLNSLTNETDTYIRSTPPVDWVAQNYPSNSGGIIRQVFWSATSGLQSFDTYTLSPRRYIRIRNSGGWTAWTSSEDRLDGLSLDSAVDLNSLVNPSNTYLRSTQPVDWVAQHYPINSGGVIQQFFWSSTSGIQIFNSYGLTPRQYTRIRNTGGWAEWTSAEARLSIVEATLAANDAKPETITSGFKTVPLQLTLGSAAQVDAPATATARYVMKYAAQVYRVRVNIQNVHPLTGTKKTGVVDFTGLWLGKHAGNGAFTAAPTQIQGAFSSPSDGSKWTSKWFNLNQVPGVEDLLSFGYTATSGTTVFQSGGIGYTIPEPDKAALVTIAGLNTVTSMPFYVWLEAETNLDTPHIGVFGDGFSSGIGGGGVRYSTLSQYCDIVKALPTHYSNSGDTMKSWAEDLTAYKWTVFDDLAKPDSLIWAMGSNDIFSTSTLVETQSYYNTLFPEIRSRISPNIYLANIMPRTSETGANEDKRRLYNNWLTGQPKGAKDLFNFRDSISSDDETIIATYTPDGTNLNATGYAKNAAAIIRPITNSVQPPVVDPGNLIPDPANPGFYLIGP